LDAFVGIGHVDEDVWIYRLPEGDGEPIFVGSIQTCSESGACTEHTSLQAALDAAMPGYTITLSPGDYYQCATLRINGVTITGSGAHLRDTACGGKAALVIKGNDTVVEGLECSGIRVNDGNGACIRFEGTNLTVRNVNFHDSQEGILAGGVVGDVLIEDSLFERLGGAEGIALGRAHAIYVSGSASSLTIRNSRILSSKEEGHEVKSRAARTVIENSVIASLGGVDSRLIDVPNGGELVVRNSVLEMGPNSSNLDLIGYGLEGITHTVSWVAITGNTIITDRTRSRLFHGSIQPTIEGNILVGGEQWPNNEWFADRAAAGLSAYPALP
jgi:hypothetical protein